MGSLWWWWRWPRGRKAPPPRVCTRKRGNEQEKREPERKWRFSPFFNSTGSSSRATKREKEKPAKRCSSQKSTEPVAGIEVQVRLERCLDNLLLKEFKS